MEIFSLRNRCYSLGRRTAPHLAEIPGHETVIEMLIQRKADLTGQGGTESFHDGGRQAFEIRNSRSIQNLLDVQFEDDLHESHAMKATDRCSGLNQAWIRDGKEGIAVYITLDMCETKFSVLNPRYSDVKFEYNGCLVQGVFTVELW